MVLFKNKDMYVCNKNSIKYFLFLYSNYKFFNHRRNNNHFSGNTNYSGKTMCFNDAFSIIIRFVWSLHAKFGDILFVQCYFQWVWIIAIIREYLPCYFSCLVSDSKRAIVPPAIISIIVFIVQLELYIEVIKSYQKVLT